MEIKNGWSSALFFCGSTNDCIVLFTVIKVSVAYPTKIGFEIEDGDRIVDGLSKYR
ncbi:hypothetical protein [Lysinibacillus xylanilyticus]|uniref:hypothetical protein n=1 Tax=Lysinibacillus xylanilyticus TaxID=582475 RepID=UPI003CFF31CB